MLLSSQSQVFLWGCLGGFAAELLQLHELSKIDSPPKYLRRPAYWFVTLLMIGLGGVLGLAFFTSGSMHSLLALQIGASAPLIVRKVASSLAPEVLGGGGTANGASQGVSTGKTKIRRVRVRRRSFVVEVLSGR